MELSVLFGIANLVLGVFLGAWYNEYRKRPLLVLSGQGSGSASGTTYKVSSVSASNPPGFLGIAIPPSVILGRQIHPSFRRGLSVDRNPATHCAGHLYDTQTGRHVTGLYWRAPGNPESYQPSVTIGPGESAALMVFVRLSSEPHKYFVFQADPKSPIGIRVPEDHLKFTGDKQFELRIQYSNGQVVNAEVGMRLDYNGHLYAEYKGANSSGSTIF